MPQWVTLSATLCTFLIVLARITLAAAYFHRTKLTKDRRH
jgi:hypothetical protein